MIQERRRLFLLSTILLAAAFPAAAQNRYDVQGPIELHGHITVKPGMGPNLEKVFASEYYPAISKQRGFRHAGLLKVAGAEDQYLLKLAFDSEELRLRWAQSEIHQSVWPNMLANYADNKVTAFSIVGPRHGAVNRSR